MRDRQTGGDRYTIGSSRFVTLCIIEGRTRKGASFFWSGGPFSFKKRTAPQPPEEKSGGVSISPPDPLTTQRRGIAIPLLWKHPPGTEPGSGSGKRSSCILFAPHMWKCIATGIEFFHHRFQPCPTMKADSSELSLVRTPVFAANEVCRPSVFSFGPCTARFLFLKRKRKWGVRCP
jgi:hypothetical protein